MPLRRVVMVCAAWCGAAFTAHAQCEQVMEQVAPQVRSYQTAFFDHTLGEVVVHGGQVSNQSLIGTWSWDTSRWTLRAADGPDAEPVAYDTTRGRAVMLSWAATLEWDGSEWTTSGGGGIPGRDRASLVYDPIREQTILFGGTYGSEFEYADTWAWDGTSWTRVATEGPPARTGGAMVFDEARGVVVMYGGYYHIGRWFTAAFRDTWIWDGQTWTEAAVEGPGTSATYPMVYDPDRERVVFVGLEETETWEWDGSTWTQMSTGGVDVRHGHSLVWDDVRRRVLLIGGRTERGNSLDIWTWDGQVWERVEDGSPRAQAGQGMAYDASTAKTILFESEGGEPAVTWEWDGVNWTRADGPQPPSRSSATLCPDINGDGVILTGGVDSYGTFGDTWRYRDGVWTELPDAVIPPRVGHGIAVDSYRRRTVLFGGSRDSDNLRGDTWEFDGQTWELVADTGPPAHAPRHGMAYDPLRRVVVLYAGSSSANQTWEWDGVVWQMRDSDGPYAKGHPLYFDSVRGSIVLFNGTEFWTWDGDTWTLDGQTPFPSRNGLGAVFDTARAEMVAFGGIRNAGGLYETFADTWVRGYEGRARIIDQPLDADTEPGASVVISVTAESTLPMAYQWRRDGEPLRDGPTPSGSIISGSATPVLEITGVGVGDAGRYDCVVSTTCSASVSAPGMISIRCAADFDGDGFVDSRDLLAFLNAWSAREMRADINGDGVIDSRDVIAFLNVWVAGC